MALVVSRYSRIEIATSKLKVIRRSIKLKELKFILKGPYIKKRITEIEPSITAKLNLFKGLVS